MSDLIHTLVTLLTSNSLFPFIAFFCSVCRKDATREELENAVEGLEKYVTNKVRDFDVVLRLCLVMLEASLRACARACVCACD